MDGTIEVTIDEQQLEHFRSLDWEEIAAKVLNAAIRHAQCYGWNQDSVLPKGNSIEDVVLTTISDIWEKPERINHDISLTTQLIGIVKSKLWNHSQYVDGKIIRSENMGEIAFANDPAPSYLVELQEEYDRAMKLLSEHSKVKAKPDLELMVRAMSMEDGTLDVDTMVNETGLTVERVYQLRRELRAIFPEIALSLQSGDEVK